MNTIKNYLDSMFLSMPNTMEVGKIKEEILQIMEDKYNELKAQGKTENEAIGRVIAEFGNIEELKAELGLSAQLNISKEDTADRKAYFVTLEDAKDFVLTTKKSSVYVAIATMLCILSPIVLILTSNIDIPAYDTFGTDLFPFIGLASLMVLIAVAVTIFIYNDHYVSKYKHFKEEPLRLDPEALYFARAFKETISKLSARNTAIGTVICILSGLVIIAVGLFGDGNTAYLSGVSLMLVMISISMLFLIPSGMQSEAYKILLQEGEHAKKEKSSLSKALSSLYWCVITVIYLGWSWFSGDWEFTWIIWPIAGIMYGGLSSVWNAIAKK